MKKSLLTTFLLLVVSLCMTAQEKVIIYYPTGNPTVINVSDVDSIKFVYEEPAPDPTPSDYKPTTFPVATAVELGLPSGTKWASWNIGATNIYSYGGYYGWGDPTGNLTADNKSSDYYKFNSAQSIAGKSADIVHAKWGGNWALPTRAQFEELFNDQYTTVEKVNNYKDTGMSGWVVTSLTYPNNYIFLPSGGYVNTSGLQDCNSVTYYWTSECSDVYAYYVNLSTYSAYALTSRSNLQLPVRGVYNSSSSGGGSSEESSDLVDKYGKDPTANACAGYAVDLGLNVLWATYNIGATKEAEFGDYYAWGCSETQTDYSDNKYPYLNKTISAYDSNYHAQVLNDAYDTAKNIWGGKWTMPTNDDFIDLENYCTFTLTEKNGISGYEVTSNRNGNKIFLPAGGFKSSNETSANYNNVAGYYWSKTADSKTTDSKAYYTGFTQTQTPYNTTALRNLGYCVRPVIRKP